MTAKSGLTLRFLGTGDAGGIPLFGCDCEICSNTFKGNGRRRPCSALLTCEGHSILIDAGRTDLVDLFHEHPFQRILLTHYHVDHVQGLFHLRWGNKNLCMPVHGPHDEQGCADLLKHSGILDFSDCLEPFVSRSFDKLKVIPVPLNHSRLTLGYCFKYKQTRLAYLTDTIGLPAETERFLCRWKPTVLVLDSTHAPGSASVRNHNDLHMALHIHARIMPETIWLTHISHELETYWLTGGLQLPENVHIATDGTEFCL
ncbi:MAG TPA: phosphonate metabolism protein PhnP [Gammaproteobacteria bacterium]|nr:phosphonate metabolism protein PhnP [Gammaproteobacteria bacterium]